MRGSGTNTAKQRPRTQAPPEPAPPPPELAAVQAVQRAQQTEWLIPLGGMVALLILAIVPTIAVPDRVWYVSIPWVLTGWIVIPGLESWIGRDQAARWATLIVVAVWSTVIGLTAWGIDRRATITYGILAEAVSAVEQWKMIKILVPRTVSYDLDTTDRLIRSLITRLRPRSPAIPSLIIGWYVRVPSAVMPVIIVPAGDEPAVREQVRSLPGNATIEPLPDTPWIPTESAPWVVWMDIRITGDPGTPVATDSEAPSVLEALVSSLAIVTHGEALLTIAIGQPRSRYAEAALDAAIRTARDADPKQRAIGVRATMRVPIHLRILGILRAPASMDIEAVRAEVASWQQRINAIQTTGSGSAHRLRVDSYRIVRAPQAATDASPPSDATGSHADAATSHPKQADPDIVQPPPPPAEADGRWMLHRAIGGGCWMLMMTVGAWMVPTWGWWWVLSSVIVGGGWLGWALVRRQAVYRWYHARYQTACCFAPPDEPRFPWWVPRFHDRW